jgi:hypothetical protein
MKVGIIACDILKNEIEYLTAGDPEDVRPAGMPGQKWSKEE